MKLTSEKESAELDAALSRFKKENKKGGKSPGKKDDAGDKALECTICHKTKDDLEKANDRLFLATDNKYYCSEHFLQRANQSTGTDKEGTVASGAKPPGKTPPTRPDVPSILDGMPVVPDGDGDTTKTRVKKVQPINVADVLERAKEDKPAGARGAPKELEKHVNEILSRFSKSKDEKDEFIKKNLQSFWRGRQQTILEKGMLEFPPTMQFIIVVVDFIRQQIICEHPVTSMLGIDINESKKMLRHPLLSRVMSAFHYNFWFTNSDVLNHLINIAQLQLESLRKLIIEAGEYNPEVEFEINVTAGFLTEFKYRTNPFEEKFELITNNPRELIKLFAGVEVVIPKLAAVEMKLLSDAWQKYTHAWANLSPEEKQKVILQNFEKFDTRKLHQLPTRLKLDMFEKLNVDDDVVLEPSQLLNLERKLSQDDRKKFYTLLRQNILPYQVYWLVPELKNMEGKLPSGLNRGKKDGD